MQLHGPGATIQSDHQGIDALLSDLRGQVPTLWQPRLPSDEGHLPKGRVQAPFAELDMLRVRARSAEGDLFEDIRLIVASSS